LIVVIVGYAAIQKSEYTISREITINAPVEKIFPYLNNSKLAEQWGPWMDIDSSVKMNYSGPDVGVGSKAYWIGAKQLGTGSATIVDSAANQRVAIKLEYTEPMAMEQMAEYLVKPQGAQTTVTWRVTGKNTLPGRVACLFMNMDKKVGGMFELGLSKLKNLIEKKGS
jgi:uncharacterized protein YndB with AHSA1/START domain